MFKKLFICFFTLMLEMNSSFAAEKLSIILDWYINPNHASLFAAKQQGFFEKYGIDLEIVAPSDPSLGPRLVAANKADIAISYQSELYLFQEEGLPLVRFGTLMKNSLNSIMALPESGIKTPKDLKGKRVGYSVENVESILLETVLENQGLKLSDIEMVNVNFNLLTALLSKQVDAVIGASINVEGNELREKGIEPSIIRMENYGVPPHDALIFVARKDSVSEQKYSNFLKAIAEGAVYVKAHPLETYEVFAKNHKDLANDLNKRIWMETSAYFSENPAYLDVKRYEEYQDFLIKLGELKQKHPIDTYAVELK